MAEETWQLWQNKHDHTVVYEIRVRGGGYDYRIPQTKQYVGWQPIETFTEVYEPVPYEPNQEVGNG